MLANWTVRLNLNPFLSRWSTLSFWSDWDTSPIWLGCSPILRLLSHTGDRRFRDAYLRKSSFFISLPTILLWRSAKMCQSEWKASLPTVLTCPSPSASSPFEFSLETRIPSLFCIFFLTRTFSRAKPYKSETPIFGWSLNYCILGRRMTQFLSLISFHALIISGDVGIGRCHPSTRHDSLSKE